MQTLNYLSDEELLYSATGVEWASFPKRGASNQEQLQARARLITDASAFVDTEAGQKLYATEDVDVWPFPGRHASYSDGLLFVHTKFSPIISVQSVEISTDGTTWVTLQGSPVVTTRSAFQVLRPLSQGLTHDLGAFRRGFIRINYTDGFPHTTLSSPAAVGDSSVHVVNPVGVIPGTVLTIFDEFGTEDVTASPSYVLGNSTVPLVGTVQNPHVVGIMISAIPPEVKIACRLAAVHYVRVRGRDAIAVQATGGSRVVRAGSATEDLDEAKERLKAYRRVI